jgi:hypothetical protein
MHQGQRRQQQAELVVRAQHHLLLPWPAKRPVGLEQDAFV